MTQEKGLIHCPKCGNPMGKTDYICPKCSYVPKMEVKFLPGEFLKVEVDQSVLKSTIENLLNSDEKITALTPAECYFLLEAYESAGGEKTLSENFIEQVREKVRNFDFDRALHDYKTLLQMVLIASENRDKILQLDELLKSSKTVRAAKNSPSFSTRVDFVDDYSELQQIGGIADEHFDRMIFNNLKSLGVDDFLTQARDMLKHAATIEQALAVVFQNIKKSKAQ